MKCFQYFADFKKFCAIMKRIKLNEEVYYGLHKIFSVFDENGDGFVEPKEIVSIMHKLGEDITEEDVSSI